MRVLLLAPNYKRRVNFGHQLFWDEILKQTTDSVQHGAGNEYYGRSSVKQIFKEKGYFDVVMFESFKYCRHYFDMAEVDTLRVGMIGDYFNANVNAYNKHMQKNQPQVVTLQSKGTMKNYREHMVKNLVPNSTILYVPHSVDANTFYKKSKEKTIDILAAFDTSGAYPARGELIQQLRNMKGISLQEGGWRSGIIHDKYVEAIHSSKMMVCANGHFNEVTMKYLEVMACGTLFVCDRPNDSEWFGFCSGSNIVFYEKRNWADMRSKVERYLNDEFERDAVAKNGMGLVMSRHTNEIRVKNLLIQIKNVLEGSRCETANIEEESTA